MSSNKSQATACYRRILKDILSGHYAPGTQLKNTVLAKELDIGLSPLREALSKLTATGLVEQIDNRGFFVTQISIEHFVDSAEIFTEIEMLALGKAIDNGDEDWEVKVTGAAYRLAKLETGQPVDAFEWLECNRAYHLALISACNSPTLMRIREHCYFITELYLLLTVLEPGSSTVSLTHDEHIELTHLTLTRQKEAALDSLKAHLLDDKDKVIAKLRKKGVVA